MKFKTLCSVTVVKVSVLWIFYHLNRMLTLKLILTTVISVDKSKSSPNRSMVQCQPK